MFNFLPIFAPTNMMKILDRLKVVSRVVRALGEVVEKVSSHSKKVFLILIYRAKIIVTSYIRMQYLIIFGLTGFFSAHSH